MLLDLVVKRNNLLLVILYLEIQIGDLRVEVAVLVLQLALGFTKFE